MYAPGPAPGDASVMELHSEFPGQHILTPLPPDSCCAVGLGYKACSM